MKTKMKFTISNEQGAKASLEINGSVKSDLPPDEMLQLLFELELAINENPKLRAHFYED